MFSYFYSYKPTDALIAFAIVALLSWFTTWMIHTICLKTSRPRMRTFAYISLIGLLIYGIVWRLYSGKDYLEDEAFIHATREVTLELPRARLTKEEFPYFENRGDDYCVERSYKFLREPSKDALGALNALCRMNGEWWRLHDDGSYIFSRDYDELFISVWIYPNEGIMETRYYHM